MRSIRSVFAVLLGIVSVVALSQAIIALYTALAHPGSDHVAGVQQAVSFDRFAAMLAANVVAGIAAGYLAALIARERPARHAQVVAAVIALLGASTYIGGARTEGASQQDAVVYIAAVVAIVAGGLLRQRRGWQNSA
jgi:hypothetical protein